MYLTLEPLAALAMTKQDEWMDGARKRRQWGRSGLVYDSMKKKQKRKIVEGFGYYGNIKMTNGGNLEIRICMSRVIVCLSWGCAVFRIFIRDPKIWTWIFIRDRPGQVVSVGMYFPQLRNTLPYQFSLESRWNSIVDKKLVVGSESTARVEDSVASIRIDFVSIHH